MPKCTIAGSQIQFGVILIELCTSRLICSLTSCNFQQQ